MKINFEAIFGGAIIVLIFGILGLGLFRMSCMTFVENYEVAYEFNHFTGKITKLDRAGYFIYNPIKKSINTIDLRPFQVCINANYRVLNCKLIQFNPAGLEQFVAWHGRGNYQVEQYASNNGTSPSNFMEIMKSYAYDAHNTNYPFLTIKTDESPTSPVPTNN